MALVTNTTLGDVSGKIGGKVYRRMNGKIFVSERPSNYKPAKTKAARKARNSFGTAVKLSKTLIADPELKEVWKAAKIEGTDSYRRIIKHNSKLIDNGLLTERNKITPEGLFLSLDSLSFQNDMLYLSLNCSVENGPVFPAKLCILYYFAKANQPLVLTQITIPDSIKGGVYELDIKPAKSIIRQLNENSDVLLFTALISKSAGEKKVYWTSTASSRLS